MTAALWPLQAAVYSKLTADTALMGLVTGVLDYVPEAQVAPYVTIGAITEVPSDSHSQRGLTSNLSLHVWSRYRGYKQAADILAALDALLDRQPLTVAGYIDVSIANSQSQELRDPDPELRHIAVTYRVWLTKE